MRRVLAVVAAAAMVAASLAIRSRMDRRAQDRSNPVHVICAAELGTVCDALRATSAQVTVESATTTADRLGRGDEADGGALGWLVPAPWPQIVDGRRRARALLPLFTDTGPPLARSPLVVVVRQSLARDLRGLCGAPQPGWKCLGEAAGRGQAKPGHADPAADALAVLTLGQATSAYFDRGSDLSTTDLDDPDFTRWFTGLERATPALASGGSPLEEMLGTRFAAYDAIGTTEAEAEAVLAPSALRNQVDLLYPSPMATADVVLAGGGGDTARRLRDLAGGDTVRRALAAAGWRVEGIARPPSTDPPLPPTNGLPSPGFLDTLRSRAQEVRR